MTKNNKAFILGSYHCCYSFTADEIPSMGETVMGFRFKCSGGAKGHGQMLAAALAGTKVSGIMRVGDDEYGHLCIEDFNRAGIDCTHVKIDPVHATGAAGVMLNKQGENIIIVVPGANAKITAQDIDEAEKMIQDCSVAGFQFENNFDAIEYAIRKAHSLGVETMVDPAPVVKFDEELYRYITYIKPNEHEASLLSGISVTDRRSAGLAGKKLLEKGVNKAVIITMGEQGAVLVTREFVKEFPCLPVEVRDTTSAGDTFAGAFVSAIAKGLELEEAVLYANCVAACAVKRMPNESIFEFFPKESELSVMIAGYREHLDRNRRGGICLT